MTNEEIKQVVEHIKVVELKPENRHLFISSGYVISKEDFYETIILLRKHMGKNVFGFWFPEGNPKDVLAVVDIPPERNLEDEVKNTQQ